MHFINPLVLWGIVAIAIPIAIHLFNFRRYRKVYFSNVRFLRNFQQRTRKQSQLLHLLVLFSRILTIIALVIAFARPYFPTGNATAPAKINAVSIFLDNSFSMESEGKQGRLFDEAKNNAAQIASAYKSDDLFQLLTNDFEGRHQRFVSREEFAILLREAKLSPAVRNFSEINSRQRDLLSNQRNAAKTAYVISDFQTSTLLSHLPDSSAGISTHLLPIQGETIKNIAIDSCWLVNPVLRIGQTATLVVRIKNYSENNLEKIPLKLSVNGMQRAVASIDLTAGGSTIINLSFTNPDAGIFRGLIEISDYPVTFDDTYYFTFQVSSSIPVLAINQDGNNKYLSPIFRLDSILNLTNSSARQLDYSSLPSYHLIILNDAKTLTSGAIQELTKFVEQGGSLLVFPSFDASRDELNGLLSVLQAPLYGEIDSTRTRVNRINTNHAIFSDVFEKSSLMDKNMDLPLILKHFTLISKGGDAGEALLSLENGDALLTVKSSGAGKIYQSAVPLNDQAGNWPRHAIFVPALLNIAFQSEQMMPLMHYPSQMKGINIGNRKPEGDRVFRMVKPDDSYEFIPELKRVNGQSLLFMNNQVKEAGYYKLMDGDDEITVLAFNYPRPESDMATADVALLEKKIDGLMGFDVIKPGPKDIATVIAEQNSGKVLWKWFVLAALLFIAAEVLLLRFFRKKTSVPDTTTFATDKV